MESGRRGVWRGREGVYGEGERGVWRVGEGVYGEWVTVCMESGRRGVWRVGEWVDGEWVRGLYGEWAWGVR